MTTMTRPTVETSAIATHQSHPLQPSDVMMSDDVINRMMAIADVMAKSKVTVPKHLQGSQGDCFAVVMQASQWGMNPFSVAQKTHLVNGTLGYEAQLVNAVIITRAPVTGRLKFDFYGDWTKVNGKEDKSPERGVIVSATFKGEDEPRELNLGMHQVGGVRNSPMWTADPRQQLAYLAVKRWSRLYCPDVILGVYTPDEIEELPERDVTEQPAPAPEPKKHSGSGALKDRLKGKKQDSNVIEGQAVEFDVAGMIAKINAATTLDQLLALSKQIPATIGEPAQTDIKNAYGTRKAALKAAAAPAPEPAPAPEVLPEPEPVATSAMMPPKSIEAIKQELMQAQSLDDIEGLWKVRVSDFIDSIHDEDYAELDVVYAARCAEFEG